MNIFTWMWITLKSWLLAIEDLIWPKYYKPEIKDEGAYTYKVTQITQDSLLNASKVIEPEPGHLLSTKEVDDALKINIPLVIGENVRLWIGEEEIKNLNYVTFEKKPAKRKRKPAKAKVKRSRRKPKP